MPCIDYGPNGTNTDSVARIEQMSIARAMGRVRM